MENSVTVSGNSHSLGMCGIWQVLNKSNKQKNDTEYPTKVEAPENVFHWGGVGVRA